MTIPTPRPVITLSEWTEQSGVPQSTANKWVQEGRLAAYRSAHIWLIPHGTPKPQEGDPAPAPLAQPEYITVEEWGQQRGVKHDTALAWIARGLLTDVYQSGTSTDSYGSGSIWLIRAATPHPGPIPQGAAAHRSRQGRSQPAAAAPAAPRARVRRPAQPLGSTPES